MQYCKHRHNQETAKIVVRLCYLQSIQLQLNEKDIFIKDLQQKRLPLEAVVD